jgi:predicted metal-dependent peptidase
MLSIGKQLTAEQRLNKATVDIMANPKYVALAGILMIGDRGIKEDIPTACTNGRDEWYGREFVDKLNDAELRFLVLHESYHKLYRHLITWKHLNEDDPQLSNMACDYVINVKLVDDNKDGFATMTGELSKGCFDEKYRNWDSAQVFHDLKKNPPPTGGGGGVSDTLTGFDEHDWDGAKEMTPEEKRELAKEIDENIRQGATMAGKIGSGGDRDLAELLEPQVNWRDTLRELVLQVCVGNDYSTWRKPKRRLIGQGIYMPSTYSETLDEVVTGGDMSGSIGQREVSITLTEIASICKTIKPSKLRMLYWDTEVCRDEQYEMHELDNFAKSTKPSGGGGTMVECVPEYMKKHSIEPQVAIIITDGYLGGSWGTWDCPVIWLIIDNKSAKPNVGKAIHVKSRDM